MKVCGIMKSCVCCLRFFCSYGDGSVKWAVAQSNGMIFDAGYFLAVCSFNSREIYSSMVYCYVSCLVFSFGSNITLGLVTGEPFSVLHSDDYIILFSVIWFLVFFTPLKRILHYKSVECICHFFSSIAWMRAILSAINYSLHMYPDSYFACMTLATLSGASGDLLNSLERKIWGERKAVSLAGAKVTLVCSIAYLLIGKCDDSDPLACVIEDRTAQILISSYLCLWGWTLIFLNKEINIFYPFEKIFASLSSFLGCWNVNFHPLYKIHKLE